MNLLLIATFVLVLLFVFEFRSQRQKRLNRKLDRIIENFNKAMDNDSLPRAFELADEALKVVYKRGPQKRIRNRTRDKPSDPFRGTP